MQILQGVSVECSWDYMEREISTNTCRPTYPRSLIEEHSPVTGKVAGASPVVGVWSKAGLGYGELP